MTRVDAPPDVLVRQLRFRYFGHKFDTVKEVSVNLPGGHSLGLVGPNGSGKSTFLNLLLGFLQPSAGDIWIGGLDPVSARQSRAGFIGFVPQKVHVSQVSMAENIALGLPRSEIDFNRIIEVSNMVGLAHSVGLARFNRILEQQSSDFQFSGGQQQLLGLARALYFQPAMLVLDEASSALDAINEQRLVDLMQALKGHVTLISVAHRPKVLNAVDVLLNTQGN